MKTTQRVMQFSKESPDLYKAFKDYFDNVRGNMGVKSKTFDSTHTLEEKEKAINKMFTAEVSRRAKASVEDYDGDYMSFSQNPMVKFFADRISDTMIDMILPEVLIGSIGTFAEIRGVDWGDSASFEIRNNSLFTVSNAGWRQKNAPFQKLEDTTVTLVPEPRQVSVITSLFNVFTNRDSIAQYIMKAVMTIEATILYEAYDALVGAMGASVIPTELRLTNFSKATAITLGQKVTSWNNGAQAVFAGTSLALGCILPNASDGGRYLFDSDFVKVGHVDRFAQFDTLEMKQVADYSSINYGLKLDDTKIFVLSPSSDKLIKVVLGGTLSDTQSGLQNANMAQTGSIMKSWGVSAITNSIAGVIEVTPV